MVRSSAAGRGGMLPIPKRAYVRGLRLGDEEGTGDPWGEALLPLEGTGDT